MSGPYAYWMMKLWALGVGQTTAAVVGVNALHRQQVGKSGFIMIVLFAFYG